MKKIIVKFLSAVLATCLIGSTSTLSIFAETNVDKNIQSELSYIEEILPNYLLTHDISSEDILELSRNVQSENTQNLR